MMTQGTPLAIVGLVLKLGSYKHVFLSLYEIASSIHNVVKHLSPVYPKRPVNFPQAMQPLA